MENYNKITETKLLFLFFYYISGSQLQVQDALLTRIALKLKISSIIYGMVKNFNF